MNYTQQIDELAHSSGDTLRSILPKMHSQNNPRDATKAGHQRAVEEFIALHGDLQLADITKRHVAEYVEYLGTVRIKDQPMAPTTIRQRLDKISAILEFSTSVDAVEYNVAKSVKAQVFGRMDAIILLGFSTHASRDSATYVFTEHLRKPEECNPP